MTVPTSDALHQAFNKALYYVLVSHAEPSEPRADTEARVVALVKALLKIREDAPAGSTAHERARHASMLRELRDMTPGLVDAYAERLSAATGREIRALEERIARLKTLIDDA